jgi:phosphate transport system substrate-binding protein
MGTFALVPRVTDDIARTQPALQFFVWAFINGDALVQKSNFVRLPDRVQALAFKAIASVQDRQGHALNLNLGP